jgi:hypothetical protein
MGSRRVLAIVVMSTLGLVLGMTGPLGATSRSTRSAKKTAVQVSKVGFTYVKPSKGVTYGALSAAAVVRNPTKQVATDFTVTLAAKDAKGRTIDTRDATISYLGPGEEAVAVWTAGWAETKAAARLTAKVSDPGTFVSAGAWASDAQFKFGADHPVKIGDVALEFADVRYHDAGLLSSIIGTVRNRGGSEVAGLQVTCAALQGGNVVGGGLAIVPVAPAGGDAAFQTGNLVTGMHPDSYACSGRLEYLAARIGTRADQLTVKQSGFSITSIDNYSIGAVIENPTDKWAWGLEVGWDDLDATGRVIGADSATEPIYIAPHGVVYVSAGNAGSVGYYDGTVASLRVHANATSFQRPGRAIKKEAGFDPASYRFEFSNLRVAQRGVNGTITSRSKKPLNALQISCGLFRGTTMVGATSTTADDTELGGILQPGKPASFQAGASDLIALGADTIHCVGTVTGLSDT